MQPSVHEIAAGRWHAILAGFGLTEAALSGRHTACPCCGGKDRFRFDDKEGRGTFYCSHCGPGTGVDLVMRLRGCGFKEAAREIETLAGAAPQVHTAPGQTEGDKLAALRKTWGEAKPLVDGDEAMRYLAGRGLTLTSIPAALRLHDGLPYRDGHAFLGTFPAMLALVTGVDGKAVTVHRTYLENGKKAEVATPKKLMPGKPTKGGAIRLFPVGVEMGIAEGIETALAASALFSVPVWSCVSAGGVESFIPPTGVTSVIVFADNDSNYTGQRAAFALANRLTLNGIRATVKTPEIIGDWLDVLVARQAAGDWQ